MTLRKSFLEAQIKMNTISDIRLANARAIAAEYKNPAEFARTIDRESTQVSRFMGANPTKKIGEKMARHIEKSCRKPNGWLDTDRSSTSEIAVSDDKTSKTEHNRVPLIPWEHLTDTKARDLAILIPCPTDHGPNTFATHVKDNTMTAQYGRSYPEGSIIYIDPDRADMVKSGDRILALIEEKIPSFKLYGEADGERYLQSRNLQYPIITKAFDIIGLVIGTWIPED
jgi:SOS-response transcriptional repressor LexA